MVFRCVQIAEEGIEMSLKRKLCVIIYVHYHPNLIKSFPSTTGIYAIEFLNNGRDKLYIGSAGATVGSKSSIGFRVRWRNHLKFLRKSKHHSIKLQRAYDKYGEENLRFKILEECSPEECIERENFYIKTHDSFHCGYNMQPNAQSSIGRKIKKSSLKKRSATIKLKRQGLDELCISLYLKSESAKKAAESLPFSRATVLKILKENGVSAIRTRKSIRKKIFCYSQDGTFIGEFSCASECMEVLSLPETSLNNIGAAAIGKRLKTCEGYVFSYHPLSVEQVIQKCTRLKRYTNKPRTIKIDP